MNADERRFSDDIGKFFGFNPRNRRSPAAQNLELILRDYLLLIFLKRQ
jgi:hypothetical protein